MKFEEVQKVVDKWLIMRDRSVLKIMLATVIANRLPSNPVWLLVVAPPSHGKTELLMTLDGLPYVTVISDLTPSTLISGWKVGAGKPDTTCLLYRIPNNSTMIMKDLGTLLQKRADSKAEIMSQLREVYDGKFVRGFGTGDTKTWEGKIGFLGGVTQSIEMAHMMNTLLGERFIYYRMESSDEKLVISRAFDNLLREEEMRKELKGIVHKFLDQLPLNTPIISIGETYRNALAFVAMFTVRARASVIRDSRSTAREITDKMAPESPARLVKQLFALGSALMLMDKEFGPNQYELLVKIALDSIPLKRMQVIDYLWKYPSPQGTSTIALAIGYPTLTTRRILEDLNCYEIVLRSKLGEHNTAPDIWELSQEAITNLSMANSRTYKLDERPKEEDQMKENLDNLLGYEAPPVDNLFVDNPS